MISIARLLGFDAPAPLPAGETESVRKIVAALEAMPPERARWVAAFAYLLGRVAHADLVITEEETRKMERIVVEQSALDEAQAVLVVQIAKTQARFFGGTENFLVTREFERLASREDKIGLLDCLFAVAAADRSIGVAEDNEIRRISNELKLGHDDFIAVRSRHRQHLAVLQRPDGVGGGGDAGGS